MKGKTSLIQKASYPPKNYPQQLYTDNLFTCDLEDPIHKDKKRNL